MEQSLIGLAVEYLQQLSTVSKALGVHFFCRTLDQERGA